MCMLRFPCKLRLTCPCKFSTFPVVPKLTKYWSPQRPIPKEETAINIMPKGK